VKIIDRYLSRQLLVTGLLALSVLSVVLVLANILKQLLGLLINHDAPLELLLSIIGYILPFSLTFTIPWGYLTAVLLVFGKMSAENELIALRSSGVSVPRISVVVFVVGALCVAICLWINVDIAPKAQMKMKDALYNIATSNPLAMFGNDKVIDQFPGYKIYVEKSEGAELGNLLVFKMNSETNDPMQVIHAQRGSLETNPEKKEILMHIYDGRFEQRNDQEPQNLAKIVQGTMKETTLPISLEELYEKNKKKRGWSQMTVAEVMARMEAGDLSPEKRASMKSAGLTEVNKRFSFSLASMAFALIGVPLAITAQRRETSIGFLLSLIIAFAYFLFIPIADALKDKPKFHAELLVWSPNVIFGMLGLVLFWRLSRR